MANKIHLIEYFPNFLSTDSIFTKMSTLGAPWPQEVGQDMDDAYFTMYSGIKNPSSFVFYHLNPDNDTANSLTIARILYGIYGENWTRLWEASKTKYTPIDSYNIQETVTSTHSSDRTINKTNDLTSTVDGTEKHTDENYGTEGVVGSQDTTLNQESTENVDSTTDINGITDSAGTSTIDHGETIATNGEADSYTFGFNSQEKVPTSTQIETGSTEHSGTDTTTTTDNSTNESKTISIGSTVSHVVSTENISNKSDTTRHSTGTTDISRNDTRTDKVVEDTTDSDSGTEDIQRQRQGNVGQNSYQELLSQEFELWKWNFFVRVFEDVDTYLTLSVYSSCAKNIFS